VGREEKKKKKERPKLRGEPRGDAWLGGKVTQRGIPKGGDLGKAKGKRQNQEHAIGCQGKNPS